ncbi:MAG TPA: serine/threonine-protein kinase [Polyangiaceae bacterium]|nr:serine/threonine-protein kinase [Polyangiaceae bacterium]
MSAPERVGKFRLLAELGRGGMARVFLAVVRGPANFEKLLAVKLLREELAREPELVAMFLDEARLAARLNHPNVVQTYEVGREGEHCFLAMDYLEGPSLAGLLRKVGRGAMPLDLHVMVLAEVLAGLHHAHELCAFDGTPLGIVHRDVSPKNVIVTYDGQVKLVDFGIAKAADGSAQTAQGVFKGTTAYAAPEQARGLPVDARADLFAAGALLWEALARRPLAPPGAELAAFARRVTGAEPRASDVAPGTPPALAAVCDRAMAFDPAARYPTALAMRDDLESWLASLPKRPTARELSALASAAFAAERAALRARVDEQLRRPEGAAPLSADSTGATPLMTTRAPLVSAVSEARPPAGRRGWVALGSFALVGALAFGAAALRPVPARRAPDEAGAPAAPAPAPASAPVPSVEVALRYAPAGATATLDGLRLQDVPFRGRFPRDAAARSLEVRAPGYVTERRIITFERDLDLAITLRPEPAAPRAAPPPASAHPPKAATPRAARPPASRHAIDDKNPYHDD